MPTNMHESLIGRVIDAVLEERRLRKEKNKLPQELEAPLIEARNEINLLVEKSQQRPPTIVERLIKARGKKE